MNSAILTHSSEYERSTGARSRGCCSPCRLGRGSVGRIRKARSTARRLSSSAARRARLTVALALLEGQDLGVHVLPSREIPTPPFRLPVFSEAVVIVGYLIVRWVPGRLRIKRTDGFVRAVLAPTFRRVECNVRVWPGRLAQSGR